MNNKSLEKELNKVLEEKKKHSFNIKLSKEKALKDLKYFEEREKYYKKQLDDAYKLPDDPSLGKDVFGDGIKNENPHLKFDIITNLQYTYGYIIGSIVQIKSVIHYLEISKENYKKQLIKEKEIEELNSKEFERVKQLLKTKLNEKKKS